MSNNNQSKSRRVRRVRAKVQGTAERPRLSVFRSHKHIYAQVIDDEAGKTLAAASDRDVTEERKNEKTKEPSTRVSKVEKAGRIGELLAEKVKKKIKQVRFDRGPYAYHGRVRAVAEGARKGGLQF